MRATTRIGLAVGLTLVLAAGLAPRASADLTLTANAWLNANGQLTNAIQGVLATKTSGTGTQADPYVFDVPGNLNLGSYTILGNTANNVNQYSATWRVAGSVTGTGNFDSYTSANNTYGGNVRIEAGGTIALSRVSAYSTYNANAGSVYLWATGTVTVATTIDAHAGYSGNAGAVTIRSEGPVSGQGLAISGSVNGYDGNPYGILTENAANGGNTSAADVSLYCRTNITLAAGISTRGAGSYFIDGAVLIRGDFADGTARAGTVSIGGTGGIRTDSGKTGGNVTIRATALQLAGGINTTAYCYGTRTGNVDIDVLENAGIGGSIDTRLLSRDFSQGSPGYVKIVARRTAVLGTDAEGYSIRTWPGTLNNPGSSASAAGDADVTLTGVDTSTQIYDPANPTNCMTSSIYVAGKINTGRWLNNNAMGNVRITAVEVQLKGDVTNSSSTASSLTALRYGTNLYGIVTHLVENNVRWTGTPNPHNILYTLSPGTLSFTGDVPYAGALVTAVPGTILNLSATNVTQTSATFRGRLASAGTPTSAVSVVWGQTAGNLDSTNSWPAGTWGDNSFPSTNISPLTASRNYYYTFVAANAGGTVPATPTEYFITGPLAASSAGDPTCGASKTDTATITITRPGTCVAGPLTVNYALSGSGVGYVSASPASGFTLAAGQASTNIVFTPVTPNLGAPVSATLTLLPGAYPSDALASAAISVATMVPVNLTANSDTQIGNAMDVIEIPPDTVAASASGSTYTYDFWGSLNLNGKRIYRQPVAAAYTVVLTNLTALTDSGAGWIDASFAGFADGDGVTVQAPVGITLNGANSSGYAIDSACLGGTYGGEVTLATTGGVALTAGGIRTTGASAGRIWITDGAGGSAGNVSIAGELNAVNTVNGYSRDGSVLVRGGAVTIASNVITRTGGPDGNGKPITIVASGALSVGGYLAANQLNGQNGGAVSLTGATVTVGGSTNGISINTSAATISGSNVGGDIRVTATAGDVTLAGGVDASHPTASQRGAVVLSAPSGSIWVGSLDANKFKSISVQAGGLVWVTGAITNFTVSESPKKITFPSGSVIGTNIYYTARNGAGLSGIYAIFVGAADTGKTLRPGSWLRANQLAFITQPPASTVAGVAFAQQPVVEIRDVDGYPVVVGVDATNGVSLALTTGTGTLGGTTSMWAVAGVADFAGKGLNINLAGTDKVLTATLIGTGVITAATSPAFTITHAAASQLVFTTQPSASTTAGVAFAQQPVVKIEDQFGNVVTTGADATKSVALTLTTGTGTLGGTTTMNAVGGVADFAVQGLNINLVGADKVLTATATVTAGTKTATTSPAFTITHAAASQLVITTPPSATTVAGVAFAQQPVVKIEDPFGNVVDSGADATRVVTVALLTGSGTLSGTLTATAVAGVADFALNGLKINLVGADKVLRFTTTGGVITSADSAAFAIVPAAASQVVVTTQPSVSTVAGVAFAQQPVVKIEDAYGNVVDSGDDATRSVALTLTTGTGTLGGTTTMNAVGGVADFAGQGLNINLVGADKVLTAAATLTAGLRTATTSPALTITHAAASQLVFTTQPSADSVVGVAFEQQPVVKIEDPYGNVVDDGADATVSVALTLTTGTGTLGGTTSMNALAGVADFAGKGLNINQPGADKVLTATATLTGPGAVTATTSPFAVTMWPQTIMQFR